MSANETTTKPCSKCKVRPRDKGGYCIECKRAYNRQWQQKANAHLEKNK
jgi:hypothetical protein